MMHRGDIVIVGIVNAKGGVGKTTTSVYLSSAFAAEGSVVKLIDLDRQGTAMDWAERAADSGTPLDFEVSIAIPRQLKRLAGATGNGEILIIDTPPGDEAAIEATLEVADFIIIPAGPRGADMTQVWKVIDALNQTPYAVLLTYVRAGTTALSEALEALGEADVSFFETRIPLREAIQRSFGTKPTDLAEYRQVLAEMNEAF